MQTSVFLPPWLSMGFLSGLAAHGVGATADDSDLAATGERLINPENAWRRFQSLQKKEAPTISADGVVHRIVDFERYDDGLLSYTRVMSEGRETGAWRLFFQDALNDPNPMPLGARQIRESLLGVYLDEALHVKREEITMPEIREEGDLPATGGKIRKAYSLQNGGRLEILSCPPMKPRTVHRRSGEQIRVGQFPIDGLLAYLKLLPLAALAQVDEVRLSQRYHPGKIGSAVRLRDRFVVRLYPFERVVKKSRDDQSEPESSDTTLVRFFYALCHEAFGHPLIYRNRYLRRELMKIVASGEQPPSPYAVEGIEDWFSEGIVEYWRRYHLEGGESADEWSFQHPYLSGLILHLLGVLEEVADPANENVELWARSMRPIHSAG